MSAAFALPFADSPVAESSPSSESQPIRRQVPSLRNREIFAAVVTGKSHSQAAAEFQLTQPRVTQIVEQVRDWMTQVSRGEDHDYTEIQKLRLAEETLRIQLDGWMRMAMQEWFRSCRESSGKATFLNQATRLATNLARLAGVDVTGKTARALAEQQDRAERLLRAQRAEKPLWVSERESPAAPSEPGDTADATPAPADVCAGQTVPERATIEPGNNENNPYGLVGSEQRADLGGCISLALRHAAPTPVASIPADKPIPKFLDKKVRKRLLALRRERTRAAMRETVG
ncbi:MAG: hypothetical protein ACR2FY_19105 [Pirellulaceae bacterium]